MRAAADPPNAGNQRANRQGRTFGMDKFVGLPREDDEIVAFLRRQRERMPRVK
jgi:hypothetical protein